MRKVFYLINKYEYLITHKIDLIKNINSSYKIYILCPGIEKKIIRHNNLIIINFNFNRKFFFINDLKVLLNLIFLFLKKKPDIIHSFTTKLIVYSGIISFFYRCKYIMNFSGLGNVFFLNKLKYRLFKFFTIIVLKTFDTKKIFYLFQTKDDQKKIHNYVKFDINRSTIISGSGVDIIKYKKKDNEIYKKDYFTIMLASRMLLNKGVIDFFEVSKFFINKKILFLIVGDVDKDNDQSLSIEELNLMNLQENVEWIGYKKNLYEYYNSVDLFCLPTYYGEGIPKVLLEAGSMSLPLITSNLPGCNEVVINNFNGYLFDPKNREDLKNTIELIIKNKDKLRKFKQNSRELIIQNFSLEVITEKTLKFYKSIIDFS